MKSGTQIKASRGRKSKPLIYLVDDEPLLLDLAELSLKDDEVRLKKFREPAAALKSFLKARPRPAVLVTDYAMGGMSGLELIVQCKRAHPALRTVLISGNVGADIILSATVKVDHFMNKPYQPEALSRVVKALLAT